MKDKFSLMPDPGQASWPPVWDDFVRLSSTYPHVRTALRLVELGHLTREQALISVLFYFCKTASSLFNEVVGMKNTSAGFPIIVERPDK